MSRGDHVEVGRRQSVKLALASNLEPFEMVCQVGDPEALEMVGKMGSRLVA